MCFFKNIREADLPTQAVLLPNASLVWLKFNFKLGCCGGGCPQLSEILIQIFVGSMVGIFSWRLVYVTKERDPTMFFFFFCHEKLMLIKTSFQTHCNYHVSVQGDLHSTDSLLIFYFIFWKNQHIERNKEGKKEKRHLMINWKYKIEKIKNKTWIKNQKLFWENYRGKKKKNKKGKKKHPFWMIEMAVKERHLNIHSKLWLTNRPAYEWVISLNGNVKQGSCLEVLRSWLVCVCGWGWAVGALDLWEIILLDFGLSDIENWMGSPACPNANAFRYRKLMWALNQCDRYC